MEFDYNHPVYLAARAIAFDRTKGTCQGCGQRPALQSHHWRYPEGGDASKSTPEDLTVLCSICHLAITTIRRFEGNIWAWQSTFDRSIQQCYTTSESEGKSPLIQHNAIGVDKRHKWNVEKELLTKKKGGNRTSSDDARIAELETALGLYMENEKPVVPHPSHPSLHRDRCPQVEAGAASPRGHAGGVYIL